MFKSLRHTMQMPRCVALAGPILAGLLMFGSVRAQNVYVARNATFLPWENQPSYPYQEVRTAYDTWVETVQPGLTYTLHVGAGLYNDVGVYDQPCILKKDPSIIGTNPPNPVIGMTALAETTFRVLTWNTRQGQRA